MRRNPDLAVESITTRPFVIDLRAKRVTRSGRRIHLTPIEWHILEVLARRPGSLISHQELLAEVWGPGFEDRTNYLRVHISAIRKKLKPVPHAPVYLTTEAGLGYRLEL